MGNVVIKKKALSPAEYLSQLQDLDVSINQDLEQLQAMRIKARGAAAIRYDKSRVQTSPQDRMCADICDIISYEEMLDERIDAFINAKETIIQQIRGLHNATYNQILYKVYVQYKNLREVQKEIGKSYSFVKKHHVEALLAFGENYYDLQYFEYKSH